MASRERIAVMTKFEGFGPEVQTWFEGLEADRPAPDRSSMNSPH